MVLKTNSYQWSGSEFRRSPSVRENDHKGPYRTSSSNYAWQHSNKERESGRGNLDKNEKNARRFGYDTNENGMKDAPYRKGPLNITIKMYVDKRGTEKDREEVRIEGKPVTNLNTKTTLKSDIANGSNNYHW